MSVPKSDKGAVPHRDYSVLAGFLMYAISDCITYLFEGWKDKRNRPRPPLSRTGETSSMRVVQTCRRRFPSSSFNKLIDEDDRIWFFCQSLSSSSQSKCVFRACPCAPRSPTNNNNLLELVRKSWNLEQKMLEGDRLD